MKSTLFLLSMAVLLVACTAEPVAEVDPVVPMDDTAEVEEVEMMEDDTTDLFGEEEEVDPSM